MYVYRQILQIYSNTDFKDPEGYKVELLLDAYTCTLPEGSDTYHQPCLTDDMHGLHKIMCNSDFPFL